MTTFQKWLFKLICLPFGHRWKPWVGAADDERIHEATLLMWNFVDEIKRSPKTSERCTRCKMYRWTW